MVLFLINIQLLLMFVKILETIKMNRISKEPFYKQQNVLRKDSDNHG